MLNEQTAQLARSNAQTLSKSVNVAVVESSLRDEPKGAGNEASAGNQ